MAGSSQGSFVHGILQARILEWGVIPFSRGSFWPRDRTQASCVAGGFSTAEPIWKLLSPLWNRCWRVFPHLVSRPLLIPASWYGQCVTVTPSASLSSPLCSFCFQTSIVPFLLPGTSAGVCLCCDIWWQLLSNQLNPTFPLGPSWHPSPHLGKLPLISSPALLLPLLNSYNS